MPSACFGMKVEDQMCRAAENVLTLFDIRPDLLSMDEMQFSSSFCEV